ncbi:MAG: hypothetical protein Q8J76_07645 [Desulfobulbaceae bacterium]|nr:hypothetical protein [Desulfobulbaceae bacterium]
MAKKNNQGITLPLAEVVHLLCPECRGKLKKLIAEKLADKVMTE